MRKAFDYACIGSFWLVFAQGAIPLVCTVFDRISDIF